MHAKLEGVTEMKAQLDALTAAIAKLTAASSVVPDEAPSPGKLRA